MKIPPEILSMIEGKPCRLRISGPSEEDPPAIYHGTVGEVTQDTGCLRIKIANLREVSRDVRQPPIEPEFFCSDPDKRLVFKMTASTKATDVVFFNTPFILSIFERQESLDALEIPIPA